MVTIKNNFWIVLICLISGCSTFAIHSFKACENENAYKLIDTSSIYILTRAYYDGSSDKRVGDVVSRLNGIKFYRGGKACYFTDVQFDDVQSLNPMNASKGIFCFQDTINRLEFKFKHVQAGVFLSKEVIKTFNSDGFVTYTLKSPQGGGYYSIYKKKKLPENFLKYAPY